MADHSKNTITTVSYSMADIASSNTWEENSDQGKLFTDEEMGVGVAHSLVYVVRETLMQDTKPVKSRTDSFSKVIHNMQDERLFNDEGVLVSVKNKGSRRGREAFVRLNLRADDAALSKNPTTYEMAVMNAVSSVYWAGNRCFTSRQVFAALTGSMKKPTQNELKLVDDAIMRLSSIWADIDFTEQIQGMQLSLFENVEEVQSGKLCGRLVEFRKVELTMRSGKTCVGYEFLRAPILFEYSHSIKEIATYPVRLLNVPGISNTEKNIVLREYLLDRINRMNPPRRSKRTPCGQQNKIKYDTIISHVWGNGAKVTGTQRKRLRDDVAKCLDFWKESGHINGYREYSDGRKISGVELFFSSK